MKLKFEAAPVLMAGMGAAAFFARKLELKNAFDPVTQLCEPWNLFSILTVIFIAAALAVAIICVYFRKKPVTGDHYRWDIGFFVMGILSAAMMLISAVYGYSGLWHSTFDLVWLEKVYIGSCAASALSAAISSYAFHGDGKTVCARVAACLVPLALSIWMLFLYRRSAENPVLLSYLWSCLGSMAAAVGSFYYAGRFFGRPQRKLSAALLLMAEFLCLMSIADCNGLADILMMAAAAIWSGVLAASSLDTGNNDNRVKTEK